MSILHKDIPDSERHDPKGLSSATASQVYVATGPNAGTWRKLYESDFSYSDKTKNIFGWNDIADSQYTSGAPRAIAAAARTKLTNNGLAAQTDTSRLGALWDTANSRFVINDLNAVYIARIQFKCTAAAAAGTPYIINSELETNNGPTVVSASTQFIKGGGAVNYVSFTTALYLGSFINNTQLSLFVTPDTNVNIYDIGFVLQRTYKES